MSFSPYIPIFMYHEVSDISSSEKKTNFMTPRYNVPVDMFEEQIKLMAKKGVRTFLFQDGNCSKNKKNIILTFDDGLKGNYENALPVLRKYNFKAIFFIAVGSVGESRFMDWDDLRDMIAEGHSVQSHTVTHRPLETLGGAEIYRELRDSKRILEEKLKTHVSLLSLPHGSFNDETLKIAKQIGYRAVFTSQVQFHRYTDFRDDPAILGRYAVTNNFSSQKLAKILDGDRIEIIKEKLKKTIKSTVRNLIGIENYRYIYRKIYNIKLSED